jgi:hypothetical protein
LTIFRTNQKILKAKAEEELRETFKPIYDRRLTILETILDLKSKIYTDLEKAKVNIKFN